MPESCTEDAVRRWHTIYPNPYGEGARMRGSTGGTQQAGPYIFEKDSYQTFYVTLALQGDRPSDWSASAWGDTGPVYVYNDNGDQGDHFPMSK